jgi:hypothetical protein
MNLFTAAGLTALTETVFFRVLGYRNRRALVLVALVNLLTNIALNLSLGLLELPAGLPGLISLPVIAGEVLVIAAEYILLAPELGRGRRLLLLCVIANCLSFGLGLIIALFL